MSTETLEKLKWSYDNDEVVTVPLIDFIYTLAYSIDSGWYPGIEWIDSIICDKVTDDSMGYLIDSLSNEGFLCPLNVIRHSDDEFIMGNGNHRLIAALFCGFTEIPVLVGHRLSWATSELDAETRTAEERGDLYFALRDTLEEILTTVYELDN